MPGYWVKKPGGHQTRKPAGKVAPGETHRTNKNRERPGLKARGNPSTGFQATDWIVLKAMGGLGNGVMAALLELVRRSAAEPSLGLAILR